MRMALLVPYWRQQQQQQSANSPGTGLPADFGILMNGGMYRVEDPNQEHAGIPWDQALSIQRRRNYVGERTGWKAPTHINDSNTNTPSSEAMHTGTAWARRIAQKLFGSNGNIHNNNNAVVATRNAKIAIADILYAARPLLWAWLESRHHRTRKEESLSRWREQTGPLSFGRGNNHHHKHHRPGGLARGWILCLVADLASIALLEQSKAAASASTRRSHHRRSSAGRTREQAVGDGDPGTTGEIRRRKLRLLLYALRAPAWEGATLPVSEGFSGTVLSRIPLLGGIAEAVLWDWILYYQHPFVAEEG
mmetsp:Transcript_24262/g.51549  ORF Transcript_24262/g.51549 Transcript_24262/m.51549 type:complete len:307 (+) Transcript_24262:150-1070(+)